MKLKNTFKILGVLPKEVVLKNIYDIVEVKSRLTKETLAYIDCENRPIYIYNKGEEFYNLITNPKEYQPFGDMWQKINNDTHYLREIGELKKPRKPYKYTTLFDVESVVNI